MFTSYHQAQIRERDEINTRGWNLCRDCQETRPLSAFSRDRRTGRCNSRCKKCRYALRGKNHYAETRENPRRKYNTYRAAAKGRRHSFELTFDEFMALWRKPCSYCGDAIKTVGIDRLDNSIGYVLENCVSCCETCNKMKRMQTKEEFLERCQRIVMFCLCAGAS